MSELLMKPELTLKLAQRVMPKRRHYNLLRWYEYDAYKRQRQAIADLPLLR